MRTVSVACVAFLGLGLSGCAALDQLRSLIQPPRFEQADGQPGELRILPPSPSQPLGGAGVRVWTKVRNPNPFGLTITSLETTLTLDDRRAATGDFPLGLPLGANQESIIPLDLTIDFADLPGLASAVQRIAAGQDLGYQLDGTVGVDAGRLGQPRFGPMTLVRGELDVRRGR
jgi:hypothetical protein